MLGRNLITKVFSVAITLCLSSFVLSGAALANGLEKWLIYVLESPADGAFSYMLALEGTEKAGYEIVEEGRPYIDEGDRGIAVILGPLGIIEYKDYFCDVSHRAVTPSTLEPLVPITNQNTGPAVGTPTSRSSTLRFRNDFENIVWDLIKTRNIFLGNNRITLEELRAKNKLVWIQCELHTKGRGGEITVSLRKDLKEDTKPILQDHFEIRDLYRFRLMAGPVFSSLKTQHRDFGVITDANGQSIISSSAHSSYPVNYSVFLKVYILEKQDILAPPTCVESWSDLKFNGYGCLLRLNPIIGINLVENPLEHFYTGASFEILSGVDIVGGVEWAKVRRLSGGFFDGRNVTGMGITTPPTRDRFEGSYFVGIAVDLGIFGTWLNNSVGQGLATLYPSPSREGN